LKDIYTPGPPGNGVITLTEFNSKPIVASVLGANIGENINMV